MLQCSRLRERYFRCELFNRVAEKRRREEQEREVIGVLRSSRGAAKDEHRGLRPPLGVARQQRARIAKKHRRGARTRATTGGAPRGQLNPLPRVRVQEPRVAQGLAAQRKGRSSSCPRRYSSLRRRLCPHPRGLATVAAALAALAPPSAPRSKAVAWGAGVPPCTPPLRAPKRVAPPTHEHVAVADGERRRAVAGQRRGASHCRPVPRPRFG